MATHYGIKKGNSTKLGNTQANAAKSALAIKLNNPSATDGVYWIDLPTVGPTQIYCLMDSAWDGGGWMMMMKGTATGTTFEYDASYWTTNNTLNPSDTTRNNADAKFNTYNYYPAKDFLAVFPDITTGTGGSITGRGVWTWLDNNFYESGQRIVPLTFFGTPVRNFSGTYGGSGYFRQDAKTFSGWASGIWSSQTDIRFYGYNYICNASWSTPGTVDIRTRWGFGWNENGDGLFPSVNSYAIGTNDVAAGIGISAPSWTAYKATAADKVMCCTDTLGLSRSMRMEMYCR